MQIKTKLKSLSWIAAILAIAVIIILAWSSEQLKQAKAQQGLAEEMITTHSNRIALRDEYLLHRNERPKEQWLQQTKNLEKSVEQAQAAVLFPQQRLVLQQIPLSFNKTKKLFTRLIVNQEEMAAGRISLAQSQKIDKLIYSQLILEAHVLLTQLHKLRMISDREHAARHTRSNVLILLSVLLLACFTIFSSMMLARSITTPLKSLGDGLKVIGDGNLDYQIAVKGDDELSNLAYASNEMTAKLKQSYTSVENLQKEITERIKIEENLNNLSLHQQALLSAIPDIIMEVDVHKIYTWANNSGLEFFGKDVIGKSADSYFLREQNTFDIVQPIFKGSDDIIYVESWQKRHDGQERLLAWWCRVLKDAQGNVTGALSSARDITERRQATEEIQRLNEELEQRVLLRTKELAAKNDELERINKIFVDRELRMRELKARIAEKERREAPKT